jgi:succinate dehydrogenase / fumarate reductase iron-sulfur subunit
VADFRLPRASRVRPGRRHEAGRGLELHIYRYEPEQDTTPRLDVFVIDRDACGPMVLDALHYIKASVDGTLTFRRSCREGICGSCSMSIDGRNDLACTAPLDRAAGPMRVYPLPHMPVIKDLVVDLSLFWAQYEAVRPWLQPATPDPDHERPQSPEERARLDGLYECILCACCSAACPSYWWNQDRFLGPAALLQARRWLADSRDDALGERLDELEDPFRLYRCHTILNCATACPKGLNPAAAIAAIRRQIVERKL